MSRCRVFSSLTFPNLNDNICDEKSPSNEEGKKAVLRKGNLNETSQSSAPRKKFKTKGNQELNVDVIDETSITSGDDSNCTSHSSSSSNISITEQQPDVIDLCSSSSESHHSNRSNKSLRRKKFTRKSNKLSVERSKIGVSSCARSSSSADDSDFEIYGSPLKPVDLKKSRRSNNKNEPCILGYFQQHKLPKVIRSEKLETRIELISKESFASKDTCSKEPCAKTNELHKIVPETVDLEVAQDSQCINNHCVQSNLQQINCIKKQSTIKGEDEKVLKSQVAECSVMASTAKNILSKRGNVLTRQSSTQVLRQEDNEVQFVPSTSSCTSSPIVFKTFKPDPDGDNSQPPARDKTGDRNPEKNKNEWDVKMGGIYYNLSDNTKDITFIVENEIGSELQIHKTKAHWSLIRLRCEALFKTLPFKRPASDSNFEVKVAGTSDIGAFRGFIKFLYMNEVDGMADICDELIKVAEYYKNPCLKRKCEMHILDNVMNKSNAVEYLIKSHQLGLPSLKEEAISVIISHITEVRQNPSFHQLEKYPHLLIDIIDALALIKRGSWEDFL